MGFDHFIPINYVVYISRERQVSDGWIKDGGIQIITLFKNTQKTRNIQTILHISKLPVQNRG